MSDVYVVENGYDYEGNDALWAGTDRPAELVYQRRVLTDAASATWVDAESLVREAC